MTQKLFNVDDEVWKEFKTICASNDKKMKIEVTEAFRIYNKKNKR